MTTTATMPMPTPTPPRVLVIAGSDSSGGAGLEADQKVLAAHQCYAMTATTALTVQNTLGVTNVHVTPPDIVGQQISAVAEDIGVDVVKIGMLASSETIRVVADKLKIHRLNRVVLDPVMVSTSGSQLLPNNAIRELCNLLLPLSSIITPNIPEALLLLQEGGKDYKEPSDLNDMKSLAKSIYERGPTAVLLKGGHMPLNKQHVRATCDEERITTVDVLFDGKDYTVIESPYLTSRNTHGTGCSLASAIAANLALGQTLPAAVRNACRYVGAGIRTSFAVGKGSGPINHFHSMQTLPFAAGNFVEYLLERPDVQPIWHKFTHHPFAAQMANGTLPIDLFKNYLIQDYLYLTHFARTHALAAYKSKCMTDITASAENVKQVEWEMQLHLQYCKEFGLSQAEMEKQKESQACIAYSRYVLDIGQSEDWFALQMVLFSCLLGYGVTANRLRDDRTSVQEGNRYWKWIGNYTAAEYQQAVETGSALIEKHIVRQSPSRIEELVEIFIRATEMEVKFWELDAHQID